ncbi:MAG: ribonuclease Y [Planctomycetes bacterium]|nr:ribonuclease Y [Planctomycetota bacterium]
MFELYILQTQILAAETESFFSGLTAKEIVLLISIGVVGAIIASVIHIILNKTLRKSAVSESHRIKEEAKRDAQLLKQEAQVSIKEEILSKREDFEKDLQESRGEMKEWERRLTKREDSLDRKTDLVEQKEKNLERREQSFDDKERNLTQKKDELNSLIEEQTKKIMEISKLDEEEAKVIVLNQIRDEMRDEEAHLITRMQERVRENHEKLTKELLFTSLQRLATEQTTESTTSTIDLPQDDMKGRIIGRDGRNIRTFEKVTGVDVIVDDTPGIVVVSAFDSVRREIARKAMEKLIFDGRIHPSRIEEVVRMTRKEIEKEIAERGKNVMFETSVHGIHPQIQLLLGRLMYRTSYGQNVLLHSIEVSHISGMIAGELGLDVKLAKRCGLLHDIGKALDQEQEGGHPELGADVAKRYREAPEVVESVLKHHATQNAKYIYSVITAAADAISAARPGARRETWDRYIKRLERLEEVALGFDGVENAYAIQAGRELRVVVDPGNVTDDMAIIISRKIAKQIEEELTYPGEIRVTLIRETRIVEVAR